MNNNLLTIIKMINEIKINNFKIKNNQKTMVISLNKNMKIFKINKKRIITQINNNNHLKI